MNGTLELVNKEYIIWKLEGKLEADDLNKSLKAIDKISEDLNINVFVFADVTNLTNISMSSRKVGLKWIAEKSVKGVAVYGMNNFLRFLIEKIIHVSVVKDRFKMFTNKAEAIEWTKKV